MPQGVNAYEIPNWHNGCENVQIVEMGGFAYLWCPTCRVFANMQAVARKLQKYETSALPKANSTTSYEEK